MLLLKNQSQPSFIAPSAQSQASLSVIPQFASPCSPAIDLSQSTHLPSLNDGIELSSRDERADLLLVVDPTAYPAPK